jgi:hypothetical protein
VKNVRRQHRPRIRIGSLTALVFIAIFAILLGSVTAVAAGFSDPDSPLYGVKQVGEGTLLAVTFDPISHADLEINLASERLSEAEAMAARGHSDLAVSAVNERYQHLFQAAQDLMRYGGARAGRWITVRDRLSEEEGKTVLPVEQELVAMGAADAAQQVKQQSDSFDTERKVLDKQLLAPKETPKPIPTPTGP